MFGGKMTKIDYSKYTDLYKSKLISAKDAAKMVKSNDRILYAVFLGRPVDFDMELAARKEELFNVQITQCAGMQPNYITTATDTTHEHFICNSWYFDVTNRKLGDKNLMFYNPICFSQLQDIIGSDIYHFDIYVQQVSPMDKAGFFSFGPTNVNSLESCLSAKRALILEVNENIPRIPGGSEDSIHISLVDYIIEGSNTPLTTLPKAKEPSAAEIKMAKMIIEMIPNRACIQLGIGGLPNTIGSLLCDSDLKDLGIHTEIFVDSMMELFDAGLITGRYKTIDRCKIAFTFALGSNELYEFMSDNPSMASHCGRHINNPVVIAQNDNLIAINNTIMVDLFGQVCSESAGPRQISGTGGQLDFVQAAFNSKGGKSFLCLSSTHTGKDGSLTTRIVPTLPEGSIVTTPRTVIDYIVTENGIVQLRGKPTWERAELLISLADDKFKDELISSADRMNIWRKTNKKL
jgi:acyl-CoA hydrolase